MCGEPGTEQLKWVSSRGLLSCQVFCMLSDVLQVMVPAPLTQPQAPVSSNN